MGLEIKQLNPIGVKLCNLNNFKKSITENCNPFINTDALYLHIFLKEFTLINLSFSALIDDNTENKQQSEAAPINKFINDQKQHSKFVNTSTSIIDFIKEYKIQYLILEKDAMIDENFKPYIVKTFEDDFSKEKFIIFNPFKK